jgi:hypothetical protein
MKNKTTIVMCLLLIACMLVVSAVVVAKRPPPTPPNPPPAGTIYFVYDDGTDRMIWSMNGDGSDKTKTPVGFGWDDIYRSWGTVSRFEHGGHHWIVRFETVGGEYPDGHPRREIFAVRDDNTITVQLTTDSNLETIRLNALTPTWGIGDNSISWSAMKWVEGMQYPTDFGIYSAALDWNDDGDLVGLAEDPSRIWDTGSWHNENTDRYLPDMKSGHDWNPDETKIVYTKFNGDMYIVDLSIPQGENYLSSGWCPKWSPDGSKIAYLLNSDLWIINPDGTDSQLLVDDGSSKKWGNDINDARWSPCSGYLTFMMSSYSLRGGSTNYWKFQIYRVNVDGSGKTSLTNELPAESYKTSIDWR